MSPRADLPLASSPDCPSTWLLSDVYSWIADNQTLSKNTTANPTRPAKSEIAVISMAFAMTGFGIHRLRTLLFPPLFVPLDGMDDAAVIHGHVATDLSG